MNDPGDEDDYPAAEERARRWLAAPFMWLPMPEIQDADRLVFRIGTLPAHLFMMADHHVLVRPDQDPGDEHDGPALVRVDRSVELAA